MPRRSPTDRPRISSAAALALMMTPLPSRTRTPEPIASYTERSIHSDSATAAARRSASCASCSTAACVRALLTARLAHDFDDAEGLASPPQTSAQIRAQTGAFAELAIERPARIRRCIGQVHDLAVGSPPRGAVLGEATREGLAVDEAFSGGAGELAGRSKQPHPRVRRLEQLRSIAHGKVQHVALVQVGRQRLRDLAQHALVLTFNSRPGVQASRFERRRDLSRQQRQDLLLLARDLVR